MEKLIIAILFFILATLGLCIAILLFLAARAFSAANEKETAWVGRAPAHLKSTKHKKNVTIYGKDHLGGRTQSMFIKNLTHAVYIYTVNGRAYRRRTTYLTTPRQVSYLTSACYIKKLPFISYLKDDLVLFDVQALVVLMISLMLLINGFRLI
jgi:hypothetical protein